MYQPRPTDALAKKGGPMSEDRRHYGLRSETRDYLTCHQSSPCPQRNRSPARENWLFSECESVESPITLFCFSQPLSFTTDSHFSGGIFPQADAIAHNKNISKQQE